MAMQPSTSEDEHVDEAAADVGKGPKPVLVTEKATGDARRRTPRSADIADWYRNADIGPGMKPILYHEKTTEDSLKRNLKRPEPAEKADGKGIADRFASWRQQRRDRRADP